MNPRLLSFLIAIALLLSTLAAPAAPTYACPGDDQTGPCIDQMDKTAPEATSSNTGN